MKKVASILFLLLLCFPAYSQDESLTDSRTEQKSDMIKIYFDHNSHAVDLDLGLNRESLLRFSNLFEKLNSDTLSVITNIEIDSYASPEGGRTYNKKLSEKRSNSIYDYLTNTISVPDSLINKKYSGIDWNGLQQLVENSNMEYRDEVLYILKNVPEETWRRVKPEDRWMTLVDSRTKHLMDLKWGNPYRYMFANMFPELRNGSVVTIYFKRELPPVIEPKEEVAIVETIEPEPEIKQEQVIESEPVAEIAPEPETITKPLFAIKTNLLFDAASLINAEVEVPIGDRWSVAGEWIFPWWLWSDKQHCIQVLSGNLEGRYWFGDRTNRPQLTGWFGGLYAGGGLYDLEHDHKGYQGEFFIAAGLSGGYAHTINKSGSLRMEYSLGVGYLKTDYRSYDAEFGSDNNWHLYKDNVGKYTWIGPTRAKISLVWMLNHKVKKGGELW